MNAPETLSTLALASASGIAAPARGVPRRPHFLRALQARKHGLAAVLLYDAPALHPVDPVGHEHGGQAVGSDDHRLVLGQHTQPLAQRPLGLYVQRRTYFVEHDDGRVGRQRTSKHNALALPAGEHSPAFTYLRLPALG